MKDHLVINATNSKISKKNNSKSNQEQKANKVYEISANNFPSTNSFAIKESKFVSIINSNSFEQPCIIFDSNL